MQDLAPIVLFVYNRPWHTEKTLNSLMQNDLADESTLFIFADGPKESSSPKELKNIDQTRKIINQKKWCKNVVVTEREENWGLAKSIIQGVTEIVNKYGKIIVLEDDIVTSPGFLKYMNEMLLLYENNQKIMHISGYQYPTIKKPRQSTVALNILSCWGWATWKRSWKFFNPNATELAKEIGRNAKSINKFNINGHAHFFEQLELNLHGKINTWAVKWYASWLLQGGTSLFPSMSLVENIGHDGSGDNCNENSIYNSKTIDYLEINKIKLKEHSKLRKEIDLLFKRNFNIQPKLEPSFRSKFICGTKSFFRYSLLKIFPDLLPLLGNPIIKSYPFYHNNTTSESKIDENSKTYPPCKIQKSIIRKYTYIAPNAIINNTSIGKFCSIGPNLVCGWGIHPSKGISTSPMFYSTQKQNGFSLCAETKFVETKPISIGNDVFIGMNVTILDGVNIGDGAIIGAGSIVSKDIPSYAIAVGNPIRIIKYRFDASTVSQLLKVKWWDWEDEKLPEVEKHFFEVDNFLKKHIDQIDSFQK